MNNNTQDPLAALLDQVADQLAEHADAVRVFLSRGSDNGTGNTVQFTTGRGNFLAQVGQAREWLIEQEEIVRAKARRELEDTE